MRSDYPKTPTGKNPKGTVSVIASNNRLQLRFRYAGKRHYISLGLPDSQANRKKAEQQATQIELDILSGHFDETLQRYKPQSALSTASPDITPKVTPNLDELWEKFMEYKRPQCSPSTMHNQYRVFSNYLKKLPTYDLEQTAQIRDHILETIPLISAKRFIVRLSACCRWAMESGWLDKDPFADMASQIKLPKAMSDDGLKDICPFTAEERDRVLTALLNNEGCNKYARVKYSHYYPIAFFLFHTGSRFSEAIALQWKHISEDYRFIMFEQAVVESSRGQVCKSGLKTQERRRFPCNAKMQSFLESIKPQECSPESLVFPSPGGKWIRSNNFRNRVWKPVLEHLELNYRKPYQTRHTFITLALEHGLDAKDVARLVGNSPEIIYKHYAGNKRDLFVPEF